MDALFARVAADSTDYAAWTSLVIEAEKLPPSPEPMRRVLDGLLAEWPLCYGYWKRYADHELMHGGEAEATQIYERAVAVCSYSVEMWSLYSAHMVSLGKDPAKVREIFERGVALVGSDYLAAPLWDRYIAFETSLAEGNTNADHSKVAALFLRTLQLPLKALDSYWLRFQQLAATRPCSELLDEAGEAELSAVLAKHGLAPAEAAAVEYDDEGARKLRLLPLFEARYKLSQRQHAERIAHETAIRRRHFHLRPLDNEALGAWRRYLSWEEANSETAQVVACYERCLVPCCLYTDMWLRYVRFLERQKLIDDARAVLKRGSGSLLKRRLAMLLAHAGFEEVHLNLDEARSLLDNAAALKPPSLEAMLAKVNLERRCGDLAGMRAAIDHGLSVLSGPHVAYFARHSARIERQLCGSAARGAELIEKALESEPANELLWDTALQHAIDQLSAAAAPEPNGAASEGGGAVGGSTPCSASQQGYEVVLALFERMLDAAASPLSPAAQQRAWRRARQFCSDYCASIDEMRQLQDRIGAARRRKRPRAEGPVEDAADEEMEAADLGDSDLALEEAEAAQASEAAATAEKGSDQPSHMAAAPPAPPYPPYPPASDWYGGQQQQYGHYYGQYGGQYGQGYGQYAQGYYG